MQTILKNIGLWLISQEWFQFEVIKLITKLSEAAAEQADKSENKIDDKVIGFIKRNKRSLVSIVKKEAKLDDTPIDKMLAEAMEKL